jgi:murein DD-endopeptidase MepM/ murein hydrolase activator NlpD
MAFPLPAAAAYRYGPAWRVPRLGVVRPYNQIRGVTANGTLLRAHDGVDVEVANGTPVLAPFSGVVVNPAALWKPWDPERYGNVVVVRSTEPTSRGYYALMAHLSRRAVRVGDRVVRGAVVGRTGQTGNAVGTEPHLHFELRAPFPIAYAYAGVRRSLDVFDPLPSLLEADPKR